MFNWVHLCDFLIILFFFFCSESIHFIWLSFLILSNWLNSYEINRTFFFISFLNNQFQDQRELSGVVVSSLFWFNSEIHSSNLFSLLIIHRYLKLVKFKNWSFYAEIIFSFSIFDLLRLVKLPRNYLHRSVRKVRQVIIQAYITCCCSMPVFLFVEIFVHLTLKTI